MQSIRSNFATSQALKVDYGDFHEANQNRGEKMYVAVDIFPAFLVFKLAKMGQSNKRKARPTELYWTTASCHAPIINNSDRDRAAIQQHERTAAYPRANEIQYDHKNDSIHSSLNNTTNGARRHGPYRGLQQMRNQCIQNWSNLT